MIFRPVLFLADVIGYVLFWWLKFLPLKKPRRILLIRLEHVGDVLLTTPAFRALRRRFPGARIDVLVRDFASGVLKGNRNVDRVIVWNAPWLSNLGKRDSWSDCLRVVKALRRERYDLAVDFHGDPRNILLARLVARYVAGFGIRGFGFLLNKVVPYGNVHAIDRNLLLAKSLGADVSDRNMELELSKADIDYARNLLKGRKRLVCISPGSGRVEKNWIVDRWARLANILIEKHGVSIVFTGSRKDSELVRSISRMVRCREKIFNLCGNTTITQLGAVIRRCSLVIGPDSGTIHVARAMNTPLIGLYTVEDPRIWGYDEPLFQNIKKTAASDISVEMVLDKMLEMKVI